MNKEEFIAKKAIIQEKIDTLKCEMMDLKQAYIDSNAPFPVGSKVCIINPPSEGWAFDNRERIHIPERRRYAYIEGYIIFCDEVFPKLKKAKKDGSMSKAADNGFWGECKIELAE
jgi:hypothetical protein